MDAPAEEAASPLSRLLQDAFVFGPSWDPAALRPAPGRGWGALFRGRAGLSDQDPAAVGRPWALGRADPEAPGAAPRRWQAIVCRGADPAVLAPLLARGHALEILAPAELLAEVAQRLPGARCTGVAAIGGDGLRRSDDEYGPARLEAERVIAALLSDLPQELADRVAPYAPALTHLLKHAVARALRVARAVEALPLQPSASPLLLVGHDDPRPILAALAARAATLHVISGSAAVPARLALARLMRSLAGSHATAIPPDWPDQLARRVDAEAALRRLELPSGAAVVVADLRNRRDFRYREMVLELIRRCRPRYRPVLLSPFSRPTWNTRRNRWEVLRAGGLLAGVRFVQDLRTAPGRAPWRVAVMARREAMPPLPAGAAEGAARRVATADFLDRQLAAVLGGAIALEGAFRAARPAHVLLVPGARPCARIAAIAARRAGIATVDVQTLLMSAAARYEAPLADRVATILRAQADLLVEHFGVAPERVEVVGCHHFELWRAAFGKASRRPADAGALVVVSQPLPVQMMTALDMLLAATAGRPAPPIVFHHHPDDPASLRRSVEQSLAPRIAAGRARIGRHPDLIRDLAHAAAVISLSSNAAMHAGALGVPVVAIATEPPQPVPLDAMGLAVAAASAGQLRDILDDILSAGLIPAMLDRGRARFFAANPTWAEGSAAARVVALAEAAAAALGDGMAATARSKSA